MIKQTKRTLCALLALMLTVCLLPPLRGYAEPDDEPFDIFGGLVYGGTEYDSGHSAQFTLYSDGSLEIFSDGTESMPGLDTEDYPWYSRRNDITKVTIKSGIINVPQNAFAGRHDPVENNYPNLTTVIIGKTVTSVDQDAFANCNSLDTLYLPRSLTQLGKASFWCGNYTIPNVYYAGSSVEWSKISGLNNYNDSLKNAGVNFAIDAHPLGDDLYWWYDEDAKTLTIGGEGAMPDMEDQEQPWYDTCSGTVEHVVVEEGVTSIGESAFKSHKKIKSAALPDTLTAIGKHAFDYCDALASISIPASVTTIKEYAFSQCNNLESVSLSGNNLQTIADFAFYSSGIKAITIPDSVTTIGSSAFNDCQNLTTVKLPANLTTMGNSAFNICKALESVTIPGSLKNVPHHAFYGCKALKTAEIGTGVETVSTSAFSGCEKLGSVTMGEGVKAIGESAFWDCKDLASVTLPVSVTTIGKDAFHIDQDDYENARIDYVNYGGSKEEWAEFIKQENGNIETGNDPLLKAHVICAPYGWCGNEGDGSNLKWSISDDTLTITGSGEMKDYYQGDRAAPWADHLDKIKKVAVDDRASNIGEYAFYGCAKLTEVKFPKNITEIPSGAFRKCTSLKSIEIPDGVTKIGYSAFSECESLETVVIPSSVTNIAAAAFADANMSSINIKNVTFKGCVHQWKAIEFGEYSYIENNENIKYAEYTVEHTDGKAATCTEDGYREHYNCSICGTPFSDDTGTTALDPDTVKIPKLGHDWGDWSVSIPATFETPGTEERVCKREGCNEKETRDIDKLEENKDYKFTKSSYSWTKRSTDALKVIVKNKSNDDQTYDNFVDNPDRRIELDDGTVISESEYSYEEGSLEVTFKASYLEKLSKGKHSITVYFIDGKASAPLTIKSSGSAGSAETGDPTSLPVILGIALSFILSLAYIAMTAFGLTGIHLKLSAQSAVASNETTANASEDMTADVSEDIVDDYEDIIPDEQTDDGFEDITPEDLLPDEQTDL